jgi:hypothetical protein
MNFSKPSIFHLQNDAARLIVDPFGGAITAFRLHHSDINPLSFIFPDEQMPANNKAGANYQGHFACIGRWGPPSNGEMIAGLPHHGEPANIQWTIEEQQLHHLAMKVLAEKDGLKVRRIITMDEHAPVYAVKEMVTNINPLGRIFNIVQHPTLAAPFLNEATIVDCNGTTGFDQAFYKDILNNKITWPVARGPLNNSLNLRNSQTAYNAVFSFIVNQVDEYGWITAFSPAHQLLFGYIWKRTHYPWIHLWQHYVNDKITYRGIEFGTAGVHQPFSEILDTATSLFGEKTYAYIDAGETISKSYFSFIHSTNDEFTGVENVYFAKDELIIKTKNGDDTSIKLTQQLTSELQG